MSLIGPDTDLIANCFHTVQYFDCEYKPLELTLQSLSPVLALYDPFGVDVPLNCDTTTTINPVMEQKQNQKQKHDCLHFTCNKQLQNEMMVVHECLFDTPHRGHTPTDTGTCRKIWKACVVGRRSSERKACLSRRCSTGWKTRVVYCYAVQLLYPGFFTQLGRAHHQ